MEKKSKYTVFSSIYFWNFIFFKDTSAWLKYEMRSRDDVDSNVMPISTAISVVLH